MITTLCVSCNRPAPEYDEYQELVQHILAQMGLGVTIIRIVSQGLDAKKEKVPDLARDWVDATREFLDEGNDLREEFARHSEDNMHGGCVEWKQISRRLNALLMDLDFMRRDLIGHFVPGGVQ